MLTPETADLIRRAEHVRDEARRVIAEARAARARSREIRRAKPREMRPDEPMTVNWKR